MANIDEYLKMVGDDFDSFTIQRRREKHVAYARMKKDIAEGTLLPTITLAIRREKLPGIVAAIKEAQPGGDVEALREPSVAHILDGLQRTYILRELASEDHEFPEKQTVHLECWLESDLKRLIYRMIVLNAGQKPMSMRWQLELLFSTIQESVESAVDGLRLTRERDGERRSQPKVYQLQHLATAYESLISGTANVDKKNIVARRLAKADLLDMNEGELGRSYDQFIQCLQAYTSIDELICRVYPEKQLVQLEDAEVSIPRGLTWAGRPDVINAFFASVGAFSSRAHRVDSAVAKLVADLEASTEADDPMGLVEFHSLLAGFNPRKINLGQVTRKLLTTGFKEYFRDEGETPFSVIWPREAP